MVTEQLFLEKITCTKKKNREKKNSHLTSGTEFMLKFECYKNKRSRRKLVMRVHKNFP